MSIDHKPELDVEDAVQIAGEIYGLVASATPLPSERDQNFLLVSAQGGKYVLKIANPMEVRDMLEAENLAMAQLRKKGLPVSRIIEALSGDQIEAYRSERGDQYFVRLVSYLPGTPLGNIKRHTPGLLREIGGLVGKMSRAFSDFDHPSLHRDFHWDLANGVRFVDEYQDLIEDRDIRELVNQLLVDFKERCTPVLHGLRKSVIHNDANDYNLLVGGGGGLGSREKSVVGILDFGDMVYSYTVAEIAVTIAYIILGKPDPLAAAVEILSGYQQVYALNDEEISVLYGLVCMRLCMSVCLGAYQIGQRPDDEYLSISQAPIRQTLPLLAQIHPRLAEATFRAACGLPPLSGADKIEGWLISQADAIAPILAVELDERTCKVIDLSIGSPLIRGVNQGPDILALREAVQSKGLQFGIGRYGEVRLRSSDPGEDFNTELQTVHLGMDIYTPAGSPVCAPLVGEVHSFASRSKGQADGAVVILKHQGPKNHEFYTLFSHLEPRSLDGLILGQKIAAGEQFASLPESQAKDDPYPHLHFQIITDLLGLGCEFPGYCRFSQRDSWSRFSIDPNAILRVPVACFPQPVLSKTETLARRRKLIAPSLSIGYENPVKVVRGWMQYLYDENGRKYLDAYNNVPHVGHSNPLVVKAAQEQMGVLNTNTRYLHDNLIHYAERLCDTLPEPLRVCFFVNSGSEANELALRLARAYTGQRDMIVLEAAYHGHTSSMIDLSPYKHAGPGGGGAPPWVHTAPIPDVYRGAYKRDDPRASEKYAQSVDDILQRLDGEGTGLAGYIAETCPSVGGQIIPPDGYLAGVYHRVRAAGGVCIADEVQTGYGRTGSHFYAFEAQRVVPDILVLGKPIGNGHPLGAVVTTAEIALAFDKGMEFFSTFGGNTVSCAVGMAVLEIVKGLDLQSHALKVGNYMLEILKQFEDRYAIVGDVRGSGMFLGVELVRDRGTLEPAGEEAAYISNRMRELGVLLGTDGPYHNVIKIRPPMPFNHEDADILVGVLEQVFEEDFN